MATQTVMLVLAGVFGGGTASLLAGYIAWRKLKPELEHVGAQTRHLEVDTTVSLLGGSKDVVDTLRAELNRMATQQERLILRVQTQEVKLQAQGIKIDRLFDHVRELERLFAEAGMNVPPRPSFADLENIVEALNFKVGGDTHGT